MIPHHTTYMVNPTGILNLNKDKRTRESILQEKMLEKMEGF